MLVAEEEETGAEKEKSWHGKEGNVERNKMTMNRISLLYQRTRCIDQTWSGAAKRHRTIYGDSVIGSVSGAATVSIDFHPRPCQKWGKLNGTHTIEHYDRYYS